MLRTRLFFNLVPFVVILLAVGVYAILLFSRITADLDNTVTGNYRNAATAAQMRYALSRMQIGVHTWMEGTNRVYGAALFDNYRSSFETNLATLSQNATLPEARELSRRLANNYRAFEQAGTNILTATNLARQREWFQLSLTPGFDTTDSLLEETEQINNDAILATRENVQKITRHVTQLMVTGILVALIIASYACYQLARSILEPIQSLTSATHELGAGNLEQLVPVTSNDELGDLAESFNKMAAKLRTYRQSTTEKILTLHRTMEATLASFPDPIFVLDAAGAVELMNPAADELAAALELKHELPEQLRETARRALTLGENFLPHSFKEAVSFRLHGQDQFFLPRIVPMRNESDAFIGVAVVLYDVTRFRLLDDAKTNLVATVSHEIKTPLTSVRMVLHLLLERTVGALTPQQNDLLLAAREDAERLLRILNDLLDLTRLEEGTSDLRKERITPGDLVQAAAEPAREAIKTAALVLRCEIEPDLPTVLVDRQRINHVFTNLLTNAIKYSQPFGEIILHAARGEDGGVQFSVRDSGPGIPEDYQDRIFDRFYRVPGQTKNGAGLGLSIAREIVLAHGGRIGVKSRVEHGSEFYFVLTGADEEMAVNGAYSEPA